MTAIIVLAACMSGGDIEFEPTENYLVRNIEGFIVYVHERLLCDEPGLADEALKLLGVQLYEITRVMPAAALTELRRIPIWIEYLGDERHPCACYHPSREWLLQNGFNPEKAGSVEIANPRNFLTWTHDQPFMVLHELAHGYHDRFLGHGHAELRGAYERAVESKSYESVLYCRGNHERAYALNNDQEYFAELSEAYFGTNDLYPSDRAEVMAHDPHMHELLPKLWQVP